MMREIAGAEAVAYALFERVCYAERKDIGLAPTDPASGDRPSRHWILSTYAECLDAVRSPGRVEGEADPDAWSDATGLRHVSREAILASDPV